MDKLEKLLADLKALDGKIDALLAADELTPEQQTDHDALVAQRDKVASAADKERRRLKREQEREELEAKAAKLRDRAALATEERTRRTALVPSNVGNDGGRLTTEDVARVQDVPGLREQAAAEARRRQIVIPAQCRRVGKLNFFTEAIDGIEPDKRATASACGAWPSWRWTIPASPTPPGFGRVMKYFEDNWHPQRDAVAGHQENDALGGQFLVPEEFGTDMIILRKKYGVARRILKRVPMMSDTRSDPRRKAGLTAYFTSEGAAGTSSTKQYDNVKLTAKDLMALSFYSNQLSADAVINIGDDLAGEITYAFTNKEDDCAFNGDGTSPYAGIIGVRTKLANADTPMSGTDSKGLNRISGTGWSSFVLGDFHATMGLLPQYADSGPGEVVWVCHKNFYFTVMQKLMVALGGVTLTEAQRGDRSARPMFLGTPVEFSQIFPGSTATNSVAAAYGNFQLGGSMGDRQQDSIAFSEHAVIGGQSMFEQNMVAIRGTERFDVNIHDAGTSSTAGPICGLATHS